MRLEPSVEIQSALQVIRRGRFLEAAEQLRSYTREPHSQQQRLFADAVLADVLQRIGDNQAAIDLATELLPSASSFPEVASILRFSLGNVLRERGDLAHALEQFQTAITLSVHAETLGWMQLRLVATIGEFRGWEAAATRLDEVRRTIAKSGNSRLLSALHLWFVEVETSRGDLDSARRHLKVADSLLEEMDDCWLQGYLAINTCVLLYHTGDVAGALHWVHKAISHARQSGHQTTRRAAHANLGYFQFALGNLSEANTAFQTALECCEPGSTHEIVILDNIAETKLQLGDLDGCRTILTKLEGLGDRAIDSRRRQYNIWALHTKIRLLLRDGRIEEAKQLTRRIGSVAIEMPRARVATESRLLAAEVFLPDEPLTAIEHLNPLLNPVAPLSPDLFAELERITGKALAAAGHADLASVHIERSAYTFDLIRHAVGRERAQADASEIRDHTAGVLTFPYERALDCFRALLEFRGRPDLLGREAVQFLKDLHCADSISLDCHDSSQPAQSVQPAAGNSRDRVLIDLKPGANKTVVLSFVPRDGVRSQITGKTFERVINLLATEDHRDRPFDDHEIIWPMEHGSADGSTAVFASEAMLSVLRIIRRVAPVDVNILITGETGTGKEVIAQAIHERSRRAAMPYLALNCAAVPRELLESQLFGHRKGAFSGANESFLGIVRATNGGTLFLDEIGEMPLEMQAKLLRFLELGEVHPLGESHPVKVNVRLLFATNSDLEQAVQERRFRRDLFYRLNVIQIKVPPLRERREEVPVLVNFFAQRFAKEFSTEPVQFSTTAMQALISHDWPGNVRQLANEVRRLSALMPAGACVTREDLSPHVNDQPVKTGTARTDASDLTVRVDQSLEAATNLLETEMIKRALREAGGQVGPAAAALGISRKGLYLKRIRLGLVDFDPARSS